MNRTFLYAVFSMLLLSCPVFAQDLIMKNNELIKCKIKEIGLDEIKYTLPEYSEDVLLSID